MLKFCFLKKDFVYLHIESKTNAFNYLFKTYMNLYLSFTALI